MIQITQTNRDRLFDLECREEALTDVHDAVAALQLVSTIALAEAKDESIREAADNLQSLERALTNETKQL